MGPAEWVIAGKRVVTPEGIVAAAVVIADGRIVEVRDYSTASRGARTVDAGAAVVLPGVVDTHVHVNEPGRTEWEGFETATRAAAAGGRSEEHTSELQSRLHLVCRLLLEKKKSRTTTMI